MVKTLPIRSGFQSTPSVRRATNLIVGVKDRLFISIHALREESDGAMTDIVMGILDFNPRPP